ncbi:MAG: FISUMP domain-containing protein [Saprospiraceae bacterium]|nr:hypothetical protein [Lewinella sp.]
MADSLTLSLQNPAADDQAVIYVGVSATLNISLSNNSGGSITIAAGATIKIYMPYYFSDAEMQAMKITNISQNGWSFSYDANDIALLLTFNNTGGTWAAGDKLSFNIESVQSDAAPGSDSVIFNFAGLTGNAIPLSLSIPLALNKADTPTSVNLSDTLLINLDNQGNVFVSATSDPLTNTIYLNFKNTGNTPLYDGSDMWSGTPKVQVTFVYGTTSGSLAPAGKSETPPEGSAWNISGSIYADQTTGWGIANPSVSGQANTPVWTLTPNKNNMEIIGTGDKANVTFAFGNVISFTPAGHTQMYVQFTSFTKNSNTTYNDEVFVLDIAKQNAPITRGIVSFFGPDPIIGISNPSTVVSIPLRWAMFYVDKIQLITNTPGVNMITRSYPNAAPVNSDADTITMPGKISEDTPVFFTLQAYNGNGGFLNAVQFSVFISANFFIDPNGQIYPTVYMEKVNQTWMAANLAYYVSGESVNYDNHSGYRAQYGMLYTIAGAQSNIPSGWRLPTVDDWKDLFDNYTYAELIAGGSSNFNAQLGGFGDDNNGFFNLQNMGFYWTASADNSSPGSNFYGLFSSASSSINAANSQLINYFLSVRYVKIT